MAYILYFFSSLSGLIFPRSKVILTVSSFIAFALFSLNYMNGDYHAYKWFYETRTIGMWGLEVGFGFLSYLFFKLGFSFQFFQAIIAGISITFLFLSIRKHSPFPAFIFSAFLLVYFPLDYVLMRNFLAFSIVCYFLLNFLVSKKNHYIYLYVCVILLCTSIHQSSLFFIFFCLVPKVKPIKISDFSILFLILLSLYVLVKILLNQFGVFQHREDLYSGTAFMYLINVFFFFLNMFLVWAFVSSYSHSGEVQCLNEYSRLKNVIISVNVMAFVLLIPAIDFPIIIRILRYITFINLILFSQFLFIQGRLVFPQVVILFIYLFLIFLLFIFPVVSDTLVPLLGKNHINFI